MEGNYNESNTFSNGCLGSHIDEERSEMRYVMRIAKPVSHQNFERNLHFLRGVCLLECLFIPTSAHCVLCRPLGLIQTDSLRRDRLRSWSVEMPQTSRTKRPRLLSFLGCPGIDETTRRQALQANTVSPKSSRFQCPGNAAG